MGIGEDLLLVAVDHKSGQLRSRQRLEMALAAAELVELALEGRITLAGAQITVVDETGSDASANVVVKELAGAARPMAITYWMHKRARSALSAYIRGLKGAKVLVDAPQGKHDKYRPVSVADAARRHQATERFAAVAHSDPAGTDVAIADLAFALLVDGVGLTSETLSGLLHRKAKARLAELADLPQSTDEPDRTVQAIVRFARRELGQGERQYGQSNSGDQWGGLPPGALIQ